MNKRIFSTSKLESFYSPTDPEWIRRMIGKTEIFFYEDDFSHEVISAETSGKREEALRMMEEHMKGKDVH